MRRLLRKFALFSDERGATAIEYALIASLLSIVILTAVSTVGSNLNSIFSSVASGF
jgi:pilus assembly protein Flp/PilA